MGGNGSDSTGEGEGRREMTEYIYGMRLRGFGPWCQPKEGLVRRMEDSEMGFYRHRYHDMLVYSRELTDKEVREYELDYLLKRER